MPAMDEWVMHGLGYGEERESNRSRCEAWQA